MLAFLVVVIAYAFALALLLRQFSGVYPDYIVTTTALGLLLCKVAYPNILDVEKLSEEGGEASFRIDTSHGTSCVLSLPRRDEQIFYDQLQKKAAES